MAKIKGKDITVMVARNGRDYKALAYSTSCELDVNVSYLKAGNPTDGRWPKNKPKYYSWQVSVGRLLSDLGDDLFAELCIGKEIALLFTTVEDHPQPQEGIPSYVPTTSMQLQGQAIITRLTITANNRDYATASVTFVGSGELKKI